MSERIVIVSGSGPLDSHVVERVPPGAIVIAVDGGIDHALAAGLHPSGLVGDLDSVSDEGLAWAEEHATIARHPTDKDETDTELALAFAAGMNPERLTLIGGGDRLDHTLAAIGALGRPRLTEVPRIDAWWNGQHIDVVHGPGRVALHLVPGSTLSLLAVNEACGKVSIDNVRWPLDSAELAPVSGLGVSNEVVDDGSPVTEVRISLSWGVLTVFDVPAPDDDVENVR